MKTKSKILIGIISLIVVFGVGLFVWEQQPSQFTVAITGQSGSAFTGVIKADGAEMSVSGVVPTNYVVTARSVDCRFEKQQGGGRLDLYLKRMSLWGGTCSIGTSDLGRGVSALMSLHNAGSSSF
jgi:hypothetical protein